MKNKLLLILVLMVCAGYAQQRKPLQGKVYGEGLPMKGILIVNLGLEKETYTDSLGSFTIPARPGDEIVVADSRIREQKKVLTAADTETVPLVFEVEILIQELREVVIDRQRISSKILNIPMGAIYTPAERRLKAGASMAPYFSNTVTGGFLPLDPLFNAISGRSRALKKAVEVEKKEHSASVISSIYNERDIMAEFNIPAEYVKGFIYYIVENKHLAAALKAENFKMVRQIMGPLALKYLELIKGE